MYLPNFSGVSRGGCAVIAREADCKFTGYNPPQLERDMKTRHINRDLVVFKTV